LEKFYLKLKEVFLKKYSLKKYAGKLAEFPLLRFPIVEKTFNYFRGYFDYLIPKTILGEYFIQL